MTESILADLSWIGAPVDALLDKRGKSDGRVDSGWFHPSDLSNPCDAAVAFSFLGYERGSDVDARVQRIFDTGSARDKAWKQYLKDAGLSVTRSRNDLRIEMPEWRIRGECDDILYHKATQTRVVAEIKTINQRGFDLLDNAPLPDHLIQVHCYMAGHALRHAVVIYENKNDSRVKLIPVPWDDSVWTGICSRIIRIIAGLQAGDQLERGCKYGCAFKSRCRVWRAQQLQEAITSTLEKIQTGR